MDDFKHQHSSRDAAVLHPKRLYTGSTCHLATNCTIYLEDQTDEISASRHCGVYFSLKSRKTPQDAQRRRRRPKTPQDINKRITHEICEPGAIGLLRVRRIPRAKRRRKLGESTANHEVYVLETNRGIFCTSRLTVSRHKLGPIVS